MFTHFSKRVNKITLHRGDAMFQHPIPWGRRFSSRHWHAHSFFPTVGSRHRLHWCDPLVCPIPIDLLPGLAHLWNAFNADLTVGSSQPLDHRLLVPIASRPHAVNNARKKARQINPTLVNRVISYSHFPSLSLSLENCRLRLGVGDRRPPNLQVSPNATALSSSFFLFSGAFSTHGRYHVHPNFA